MRAVALLSDAHAFGPNRRSSDGFIVDRASVSLPEVYWSAISTLVITQSSLGAALTVSWQRFVGTLLGAILGGMVAIFFAPQVALFGAMVSILGLLCMLTRSDHSAYRFGGIALAIVMLVPTTSPAWRIALDRFAETSIGIGVALILAAERARIPREGLGANDILAG